MDHSGRRWFTVAEAAEHFFYNKKTFYSLVARGMLPEAAVLRLGRQLRINIGIVEKEGVKK